MFSGQGSQYVQMGVGLYQSEPLFREVVDECATILEPLLGRDIRDLLYPPAEKETSATEALQNTAVFTQPALFTNRICPRQIVAIMGHPTRRHDRPQHWRIRCRHAGRYLLLARCAANRRQTRRTDAGRATGQHVSRSSNPPPTCRQLARHAHHRRHQQPQ